MTPSSSNVITQDPVTCGYNSIPPSRLCPTRLANAIKSVVSQGDVQVADHSRQFATSQLLVADAARADQRANPLPQDINGKHVTAGMVVVDGTL